MNLKIHINKQIGSNNILNAYTTEMLQILSSFQTYNKNVDI